ncbi:hypothetical protein HYC85_011355 [Camellia sinensis]|uniref:Uncharacterized protein n=1 Tax=Camellia sinensis TaxID=4442 RepID=A0A7J7H8T7_CAMSI|nr:hypothetical protein HYC85_011355 [Camellia sinensis]
MDSILNKERRQLKLRIPEDYLSEDELFVLPHELFANFILQRIALMPKGVVYWKLMKTLSIGYVKLNDGVIDKILEGSPILENLELYYFYGFTRLHISKANLKIFILREFWDLMDIYEGDSGIFNEFWDFYLEISTPNLHSLEISGFLGSMNCRLADVSSLVDTSLNCYLTSYVHDVHDEYEWHQNVLRGLLESLVHVKNLTLGYWALKVVYGMGSAHGDVILPIYEATIVGKLTSEASFCTQESPKAKSGRGRYESVDASCVSWRAQTVSFIHVYGGIGSKSKLLQEALAYTLCVRMCIDFILSCATWAPRLSCIEIRDWWPEGREPYSLELTIKSGRQVVSNANNWSATLPQVPRVDFKPSGAWCKLLRTIANRGKLGHRDGFLSESLSMCFWSNPTLTHLFDVDGENYWTSRKRTFKENYWTSQKKTFQYSMLHLKIWLGLIFCAISIEECKGVAKDGYQYANGRRYGVDGSFPSSTKVFKFSKILSRCSSYVQLVKWTTQASTTYSTNLRDSRLPSNISTALLIVGRLEGSELHCNEVTVFQLPFVHPTISSLT